MGVALSSSSDPGDHRLWQDWYAFTLDLAVTGAFSADSTEQKMARTFITASLGSRATEAFLSPAECRAALEKLTPGPDHMFFFEYNFLYVLTANGRAEKSALGDHSPAGYAQRRRFYSISDEARLTYSRRVAAYLIFLAENTGLVAKEKCAAARRRLEAYTNLAAMIDDIGG
jgi:hypothetical protein